MPPVPRTWVEDKSLDIFVESWSSIALTIQVRGISDAEQIYHDHTTNSDRSINTSTFNVNSIPKFITARASSTGLKRGVCYVRISLRAEGVIIATLTRGYISDTSSIYYPYGPNEEANSGYGLVRSILGTNPAAGAEMLETVPTGARWRLQALKITFVTDATVSNRLPEIVVDNGTFIYLQVDGPQNITASTTRQVVITPGIVRTSATANADTIGIPSDLYLEADYRIRTLTSNLQAGDNYAAPIYNVEEWISP